VYQFLFIDNFQTKAKKNGRPLHLTENNRLLKILQYVIFRHGKQTKLWLGLAWLGLAWLGFSLYTSYWFVKPFLEKSSFFNIFSTIAQMFTLCQSSF